MKFAEWSVKNSLLVNLVTVFILIAGGIALFTLNREAFPNIKFDVVQVSTRYAGSTPSQMEKLITIPLEKELKDVNDIKEMLSVSSEGISLIFLTLEPDAKDKPKIVNDIQRAVDRVDDLPTDLEDKPIVFELTTKDAPVLEVSLFGQLSPEELRVQTRRLENILLENPKVSKVSRKGYREPEFSVEVQPDKMRSLHVSLTEVMTALKKTNVNLPGGEINVGDKEVLLRVSGEFYQPKKIENVIVRSNDRGYRIKIKDLAKVVPSLEELTVTNRTDGSDAINLEIAKKEGWDIIDLVDEIQLTIQEFLQSAPQDLKITIVNDISFYVKRRLRVLINNGVIGLSLLMIPLMIFLSLRTAASAILGIITALAAAFAAIEALGITINLMSLFGMIMVLGMLVDEDIVIAENVHRRLEEGISSKDAAIKGTSQVAKAVFATVLTTITAFLPLLFMKGIMGKFVFQIPLVVIITLSASILQALFILPSHISDFNNMTEEEAKEYFRFKKKSKLMESSLVIYERLLRSILRYRYFALVAFILLLGGVGILGKEKVPFILFPERGIEQFFIRVETEIGTPVEETTRRMQDIEKILKGKLSEKELDHYITQGGITQNDPTDPFTQRGSHVGQLQVFLKPPQAREKTSDDIIATIRPLVEALPGFKRVSFDNVRPGPPVGKPVAVRIRGDDFDTIIALAEKYQQALKKISGVKDIKSDFEWGKDELTAILDEELMAQAGLTYQDVAVAVRIAFDGGVATTIKESDEEIDVVVRFPAALRKHRRSLEQLVISNTQGNLIPLEKIATFKRVPSIAAIKHDDRKRLVQVTANVDGKITTSGKVNAKLEKDFKDLLQNYPSITVKYGGEEEDTQEALADLKTSFLLAIFLMFIILSVTFRSLFEPFIIMTTIPMGIIGVIVAFFIEGEPLTFLAFLGIVGFSGVVVDSGIILIDFINHERRDKKLSLIEAIIAGAKLRLRAIILTTLTTILGIFPAAFGIGGADPFIQPMAKAMNWGIGVGSSLALFMIPVLIAVMGDVLKKIRRSSNLAA